MTVWVIVAIVLVLVIGFGGYTLWRIRRPLPYPPASTLLRPLPDDHQRWVDVEGVVNLRDIGGYRTQDGHHVAWGKVYRSASLSYITQQGKTAFDALGVRLICDLRSTEEMLNDPDPTFIGTRYIDLNMQTEGDTARRLWLLLFRPKKLSGLLPRLYTDLIIEQNAPALSHALHLFLDPANLPMLVHCTAGKDRTGVVVALVLALLGVDERTIIADYSQSNHFYAHYERLAARLLQRLSWLRMHRQNLFPLLVADPATLQTVFEYLRANYGSIEAYAHTRLSFDEADIAQLRRNLLASVDIS